MALVALAALLPALGALDRPLCVFRAATGLPCPGCGLTRASLALLRLDLGAAWSAHPLVLVVTPLLAWAFLAAGARALGRSAPGPEGLSRATWIGLGAALLLVWGLRLAAGAHPDVG
ncbi:MAG: DUF2752 domain-containing protein [Myxococcota bacterium]